jgi:hypothetical protein
MCLSALVRTMCTDPLGLVRLSLAVDGTEKHLRILVNRRTRTRIEDGTIIHA